MFLGSRAFQSVSRLSLIPRRALLSHQIQDHDDSKTFRDFIERPRETLGIDQKLFREASFMCELISFRVDALNYVSNHLVAEENKKPQYSSFLLCDLVFRRDNSEKILEASNKQGDNMFPTLLPWGLIRPITVDTWVGAPCLTVQKSSAIAATPHLTQT